MPSAEQIRALNDAFRQTFDGGRIVMTSGVASLPAADQTALCALVQAFDTFDTDNDPHDEHDFGEVTLAGQSYLWKIAYYDRTMDFGSPNPADPDVTTRVLTLMHQDEY